MSNSSSIKVDPNAVSSNTTPTSTNNNHNCNSGSNNNVEQPQTKRQKIEKIKTNINKSAKVVKSASSRGVATATASPPPDIIDTAGVSLLQSSINGKLVNNSNQQQLRCSSLSSSANSISTPSSTNNSPTSTPSGSRATSLSHLLNDQGAAAHILPGIEGVTNSTSSSNKLIKPEIVSQNGGIAKIGCTGTTGSSSDEVDRITLIPDLLSIMVNTTNTKLLTEQTIHQKETPTLTTAHSQDMREFETSLNKQCLCGVSERTLRKPFQSHYSIDSNGQKRIANLSEWPTEKLLQFLSNLQLLFDIYLKQNSKGFICARIMDVCDVLIRNDHNLIDEIIVLAAYSNEYVQFLAARVLASFLVIAKQELNDNWLKNLVDNLFNFDRLDGTAVQKIHFSLEIIKRIVEWKDIDLHPLEDEIADIQGGSGSTGSDRCRNIAYSNTSGSAESDGLNPERFFHFQPHQPTLETNYFALQFRGTLGDGADHEEDDEDDEEEIEDDEEDDLDDDVLEESMVQAHARRNHHHHVSQISMQHHHRQHFPHVTTIQSNTNYLPTIPYESVISASHYVSAHTHPYNHQQMHQNSLGDHHSHTPSFDTLATHFSNTSNTAEFNVDINDTQPITSNPVANSLLSSGCHIITLTDSESFDTSHLKGVTIKILENKWPALVKNMSALIVNHMHIDHAEHCILNFLQLWENIISVKANLSVVETRPFYAQLDKFELLLQQQQLSCTVYKQLLCLFNEALCYGSTLALQDMLPVETCRLAQRIVRHVKEARILDSLPRRQPENMVSFLGFKRAAVIYTEDGPQTGTSERCMTQMHTSSPQPRGGNCSSAATVSTPTNQQLSNYDQSLNSTVIISNGPIEPDANVIEMDKTILQKMVLLVLKSVAVTVKEIRSDSSDSSIDSHDCDAYQDMVLIERSIRDVLRKLESFIKHKLEFHPECHFSKILIHLFDDQDDHLIEAMVCTLDVTAGISFRNNAFPELVSMLNPVYTFLEFLKMISNSSDLLLDLLVSNETCFLLYLLRFLKYIRANWDMFLRSCHDFGMGTPTLDEAMSVLIRLRLHISRLVARQLYPYDISPVLRLLESCESLYEGNDRSLT
ncbi:protein lines isoform X1 [Anastrepha obliqua]|uniref:protein lines isoform X1 n=1 Tax=Anastrepha obliqua TaxID=95512 RepID=UPI00240A0A7A|nr:protein lines isoform X1 [Anastrepha obliqua]XP_054737295.1 protein lines isoform X1 [Anastrepha obliqua]XP_054737296.1 protein lines isoform X1 [Anastrepha obliqua]